MTDQPTNGQFQGKLIKNVGYVAVIVIATIGVIAFFQRPVAANEDKINGVDNRVIRLETNYQNILDRLESIDEKLK